MPHRDQAVPLVYYANDGERREVGTAKLKIEGDVVHIDATITDVEFAARIQPDLDSISIGRMVESKPVMDDREPLPADHIHNPVQHRDGRQPWCNHCGLDGRGNRPISKIQGRI